MLRLLTDSTKVYMCIPDTSGENTTVPGGLGLQLLTCPGPDLPALIARFEAAGVDCAVVHAYLHQQAEA